MKKYAAQIEKDMAFLLSGNLKESLINSDVISHLSKARNLLENAGLRKQASSICKIIERTVESDERDIEVEL